MSSLTCFSESRLEQLRASVAKSLERYTGSGFYDLAWDPGWSIEVGIDVDLEALGGLDGTTRSSAANVSNTLVVDRALGQLSPSLANEERIWARLTHVEGFDYARQRWLTGVGTDLLPKAITTHFFALGQTGVRDDNALSRLWWNACVVKRCYQGELEAGLKLLLKTADVRSNLVERIWLTGRRNLARGVFRLMERDSRVLESENAFREFMKTLNVYGGGLVFESMDDSGVDSFVTECLVRSRA